MPLPFLLNVFYSGWPEHFPSPWKLLAAGGGVGALTLLKTYSSGASNTADRNMHGRVVLMTGGTSGIGAEVALSLARRGAQLVLLTRSHASDPFLVDYIDGLRAATGNQMIYTEQVDLTDLLSVRQFATKWIDNAPPRRLDMIILCAATLTPATKKRTETRDGVEETWMVNYLANFHLLGILSPAIKAQPFDRDVRIIFATCSSYIRSPLLQDAEVHATNKGKHWSAGTAYASSKMALMTFAHAFQKHLDSYKRPDELPMNAKVVLVDPGYTRTPGMRRWMTRGSLWGLLVYLLTYALVWLFLKSPLAGAQSILFAAMDGSIIRDPGGKLIKECMEVDLARKDVKDEEVAKKLWLSSDKLIETTEKRAALRKAEEKKKREEAEKLAKAEKEQKDRAEEIEALVNTIKKGKAREKEASGGGGTPSSKKAKDKKKGQSGKKASS
ncbi:hypothetical protein BD289DRAFT_450212 [Coniella lustricola]|uniref:Oxidoreductase n=1 Tax=Coniella lustricola TaxID=2025994 RepID=A0A2T3AJ98_9PEZI|nr:hypothetical protein BD289DRAFT_450212 [Coniella lustricola]